MNGQVGVQTIEYDRKDGGEEELLSDMSGGRWISG